MPRNWHFFIVAFILSNTLEEDKYPHSLVLNFVQNDKTHMINYISLYIDGKNKNEGMMELDFDGDIIHNIQFAYHFDKFFRFPNYTSRFQSESNSIYLFYQLVGMYLNCFVKTFESQFDNFKTDFDFSLMTKEQKKQYLSTIYRHDFVLK